MKLFHNITLHSDIAERHNQLIEHSPDLITINCREKIVFINPAGVKLMGAQSAAELIGRSVKDFVHPDNRELSKERLLQLKEKKQPVSLAEEKFIRLDGSIIYVEAAAMPVSFKGRPAIMVIAHDITRRKHLELSLKENEEQFRAITESAPEGILIVDNDGNILSWSNGARKIFGYATEEIIGRPASDLLPAGHYRQSHEHGMEDLHATGQYGKIGTVFESVGLRKDGTSFPIEVSLSSYETSRKIYYYAVIIRDVSERKQTEQRLIETNAFLDNIIESSLDGIVVTDREGCITRVNSCFSAMLGYPKDDCIGKQIAGFFAREPASYQSTTGDTVKITEQSILNDKMVMERLFSEGKVCNFETYMICRDRRVFPVSQNVVLLYDSTREIIGAVGILRDISTRKQFEKELSERDHTLRTLINVVPETLFLMDTEGRVIMGNEMMARRFNTNTDNLPGTCVYDNFSPEVQDSRKQYAREAKTKRERIHFEDCRNNRCLESFVHPITNEDGVVDRLAVYSLDITERKQAERELRRHRDNLDELVKVKTAELTRINRDLQKQIVERELMEDVLCKSEEKYRMLVEHANSIILRMDINGGVLFFNEFAQKFFGYAEEEILGRSVVGTIVPKTDTLGRDLEAMIRDLTSHPEHYAMNENENILRSGERVWVAWTNKAIVDNAGNVTEILCIGTDITRSKLAEQRLLNYQKQLQSLALELSLTEERERRRIAVDLHDRIAQNMGLARIKAEELCKSGNCADAAQTIAEIRTLLDQTIQATRSLTFELCPPVLYELGFETALEWQVEEIRKLYGLTIHFENKLQAAPLDNDMRVILFQATRELLVNVAKHAGAKSARVCLEKNDSHIRINVEDDGSGFDMAEAERRIGKNGGFGLFSIRERLKYLGGRLECDSQQGRGTRISLVAPMKKS
jgi:PAS domain S-box-containing protein